MPSRPVRTAAIIASIAVVIAGGAWGVSRLVSDDDAPSSGSEATNPTGTGVGLDVSAGGPYRTEGDAELLLTASVAVTGQTDTTADLTAIGTALLAFRDDHGSYPPAYLIDDAGAPTVSWRVLLLPYLDQADLYEQFDLTKPWDDPANLALADQIPGVYQAEGASGTDTAYAGVAGEKHIFRSGAGDIDGGEPVSAVTDGNSMTIAVGPVGADVTIPWTAPDDIDVNDHDTLGDPSGFDGPGDTVTPLLFLDGVVRTYSDDLVSDDLLSWASMSGDSCSPPSSLDLEINSGWDFDADGTIDAYGPSVVYPGGDAGDHEVALTVTDEFGGVHVVRTTVTVS